MDMTKEMAHVLQVFYFRKVTLDADVVLACLVLLSSTMVTLTSGTMPIFMLAEPVILLAAVIGFVVCFVKSRKKIG